MRIFCETRFLLVVAKWGTLIKKEIDFSNIYHYRYYLLTYVQDCNDFMCGSCKEAHSKTRLTKNHVILDVEPPACQHPLQVQYERCAHVKLSLELTTILSWSTRLEPKLFFCLHIWHRSHLKKPLSVRQVLIVYNFCFNLKKNMFYENCNYIMSQKIYKYIYKVVT